MAASWQTDPRRIVEAEFKAGATAPEQIPPPTGVEIAFVGRSNVGKSSLLNALAGRRNLVRTSSTPGCTRQLSFFEVRTKDDAILTLVDLPGYGYAKRSKQERSAWGKLIEGYLLERPTLAVAVSLVDCRRGIEDDDAQLHEMLSQPPRVARTPLSVVTVATKLDKLPSGQRAAALKALRQASQGQVFGVSVEQPETIMRLWLELRKLASILPSEAVRQLGGDVTPERA